MLSFSSAAEDRATCRNCDGDDCSKNILPDIIEEDVLTSGYFGVVPLVSTKPKGKKLGINAPSAVRRMNMPTSIICSCVHCSLLHVGCPEGIFMYQPLHDIKLEQSFQWMFKYICSKRKPSGVEIVMDLLFKRPPDI